MEKWRRGEITRTPRDRLDETVQGRTTGN
jgi:hypothetical protein